MPDTEKFFITNSILPLSESEKRVLGIVHRRDGLSQPIIARETGFAQQSVSRLVNALLERGALCETDRLPNGRRGQPSMHVKVAADFACTVGIALMSDAISLAVMDFSGAILEVEQHSMPAMTRRPVVEKIKTSLDQIIRKRGIDRSRIFGCGVGVSGYSLGGSGRFNTVRSLDDWALVNIEEILTGELGIAVWAENDGNAAAVGESLVGAGRSHASFAYLYIAAGLGGGIIINHELVRGCHGNAGEVALILPQRIYPHPNLELLRQILAQHGTEFESISDMLAAFDIKWPGVDEWIVKTRESFSLICSALAATLDPQAIVIGGRIPGVLAEKVIPHIEIYNEARRLEPRMTPRLIVSETAGDACAIGAAALPFKSYFFSAQ